MANIIFCTINNIGAKLGTDKTSSWNIWLQESDFSQAVGKTYSQQKRGFRNWCVDKKTHSVFHDLELETWGNIISSRKKPLNLS